MSESASYTSWIASKYATSWQVAAMIVLNYVATGYLVPAADAASNGVSSHLLDFVWSSGMAASLLLFGLIYKSKGRRTLIQNISAWVASTLVATALAYLTVLVISGSAPTEDYTVNLMLGTMSLLGTSISFTLLVSGFSEGRQLSRNLKKSQRELLQTRSSAVEVLSHFALQLSEPLRSMLNRLNRTIAPILKAGEESAPVIAALGAFIQEDLRTTISEMQSAPKLITQPTEAKPKLQNRAQLLRVQVKQSVSLVGLYLLSFLFFAPASMQISGMAGLLAFSLAMLLALSAQVVLFKVMGSREIAWPVLGAVHGAILFVAVFFIMTPFAGDAFPTLSTAISAAVIAFLSTATQSAIVRRTKLNEALQRLNTDLRDAVVEIEKRANALKSRATRSVHNDVQAKLLRLRLQLSVQEQISSDMADESRKLLNELTQEAQASAPSTLDFEKSIAEIEAFWRDALSISTNLDNGAIALLKKDTALVERVLAVLREALTNAAKYSLDGQVQLSLSEEEGSRLVLKVTNLFNPSLPQSRTGVGTEIIDENATTWSRVRTGSQFALTATFASL